MNSLLGIGRKARLGIGRMIYPDYDAITDLLKENERILGTDTFRGSELSAGQFRTAQKAAEPEKAPVEDVCNKDDSMMFEQVSGSGTEVGTGAVKAVAGERGMSVTPTSDVTVVPAPGYREEAAEGDAATDDAAEDPKPGQFFPGIRGSEAAEDAAAEEPEVISFPIEDEVVDMMSLTVDGIVGDAIEFCDVSEENNALEHEEADEACGSFCACDGTVIDTMPETVPAQVCQLSAPARTEAIGAPAAMPAVSAPAEVPAICAPAYDAEEQAALVAAGVEVFTSECIEQLVAAEAEEQSRLEAAIAEAALVASTVKDLVQKTVDRLAAEEAERQARVRAAVAQAAMVAEAVRSMTDRTISRIAEEESAYVPVQEQPAEVRMEAFVPAEDVSSDVAVQPCAVSADLVSAEAEASDSASPMTSVSFGFFGLPRSPMSRASSVCFRFGRV